MYQQFNMRSLIRIKMFRSFKSKEHIHKKSDDGMILLLYILTMRLIIMTHAMKEPVFGVSDQVRHKPRCTATEDEQRFEISD